MFFYFIFLSSVDVNIHINISGSCIIHAGFNSYVSFLEMSWSRSSGLLSWSRIHCLINITNYNALRNLHMHLSYVFLSN